MPVSIHSAKFTPRHWAVYVLLCAIWGSTWLAISVAVRYLPPFGSAALRFLVAAVILAVFAVVAKLNWPRTTAEWKPVLVLSVTMMAFPYGLLFWAEQHVTGGMAAVLNSNIPIMVALINPLMGGPMPKRRSLLAMVIALGAVAYIFQAQLSASPKAVVGGAAILLCAASSAFSAIYARRHHGLHPAVSTCLQLAVGSVILFIVSFIAESGAEWHWTRPAIIAMAHLAFFGSAVAFAAYYWLLRQVEASQASTIALIVPLVAIYLDAALLQVRIPITMIFASLIVIGSVGVVLKPEPSDPIALELKSETVAAEDTL